MGGTRSFIFSGLLFVAVSFVDAAAKKDSSSASNGVFSGDATYTAFGLGACEMTNKEPDLVAAVNSEQFGTTSRARDSFWCNKCVRVSAPKFKTSVVVKVVDRSIGPRGKIVLSKAAFKKLASPDEGRIQVNWNVVPCK